MTSPATDIGPYIQAAYALPCSDPAHPVLLSGGYITDVVGDPNFGVSQSFPAANNAWQVNVWNISASTYHLTVYAVCGAVQ